jgi:acetyltransferase-like isoleucine patch superfamily enzyme
LPRIRAIYANHDGFADLNLPIALQKVLAEGIEISEDDWIGSGVQISDGVSIGRGRVIGAGVVVIWHNGALRMKS